MALPKFGKFLLWFFGAIICLAVVSVFVITLMLGKIVKSSVNELGPQLTGTTVELAEADISLFSGSATLQGLRIGNPAGWGEGDLASLGHIHLDLEPMSIFGDTIVIEDLDIESPVFRYEAKDGTSNVNELLTYMEQILGALGGEDTAAETTPEESGDSAPVLLSVGHFGLRGGEVTVIAGDRTIQAKLPDIDMTDLGTPEQGLTPGQLAGRMSKRVLADIATAAAKALAKQQLEKALGGKLKGIFGGGD